MQRAKFQDSVHGMLFWLLDYRSTILDMEGEHRPGAVADHIACCYRELGMPDPSGTPIEKSGLPFDAKAYLGIDRDYRRPVVDLFEFVNMHLRDFITYFYLHGSLATLDYEKGWSDLDTFMVIKQDTVTDGRKLRRLRQLCLDAWHLFLMVTPLQHHGFIVATEGDLMAYSSHYLPLPVFDLALSLIPDQQPARFCLRSNDTGGAMRSLVERRDALKQAMQEGVLKHHPRNGEYLLSHYRNADDAMGQLFSLLGYVMTVPAYFLDACGQPCHKKDSFVRARPYFSDHAWSIIDRASEVRRTWPLKEGVLFTGNAIPQWVQDILGSDYIKDSFLLINEAVTLVQQHQLTRQA